jgi:hypothetical protein
MCWGSLARLMASSIIALSVALLLLVCLWVGTAGVEPWKGDIELTPEDRAVWPAKAGLGIVIGETGVESKVELGVVAAELKTTSFSSQKTGVFFSELSAASVFRTASLARFPRVGTRVPEPTFLTSIGRATTFLATIELLLLPNLDNWGICGVRILGVAELEGVVAPDLTLTTFAWARKAC